MTIRRLTLMALLLTLTIVGMPSLAQDNEPITLLVDAGFDNFYRPGYWLPLQIQVRNEGVSFVGRLTVRPETSGRAVNSAFSTPIDLPTGSDKTVFLYIQAQQSSGTVIIELIDDEGVRFAEQAVGLTAIHPNDALHVVVSSTGASSIPLNAVSQAGYTARQGRWQVDNLPSDVAALAAIDTLIFYDVQSDEFTVEQLQTLEAWVATGGHFIIVAGPSWAQTTANLSETLVPFVATGSQNIDDISTLSTYINATDTLSARTFVTTGDIANNATVLVETEGGLPLLLRREFGLGVIDFLTVDPTLAPLRAWTDLPDFWFTVLATAPPEPSWSRGLLDLQDAARSIAILPNIELLPPASSMILFIAAYILLIGPINYFVLSRLRRRAWAWVTIPLFILTFTLLAWNVGFNLRGNEVIVSRLYVIQSFADTEVAYQEQLVGVLSPRRETYTINAPRDTVLGTLPGVEDDSLFSANVTRSTADVSQGQSFSVENIAIDGGIFANFSLSSITAAPNISGQVTIAYLPDALSEETLANEATPQSIRGVVRNDSDVTLEDVLILTRNRFYRVEDDFAPGDILDFDTSDFEFINDSFNLLFPIASPIQSSATNDVNLNLNTRRSLNETLVTSRVLLNLDWSTRTNIRNDVALVNSDDEELSRRRAFLRAFMRDQYATGGIGNQVYVLGWTNEQPPDDVTITDVPYRAVDTTLHIIELENELELPPSTDTITLSADQFTWATSDVAVGQVLGNFNDLTIINPGWAEFQVMPLEGAILANVSEILIEVNRGTSLGRQVEISLWNFETGAWDLLENTRLEEYVVSNPAPYLGRANIVNMRIAIDTNLQSSNANGRVLQLRVIHKGNF